MAEPARHLYPVDPETGELLETCPNCAELQVQLAGAEKEIRAWRRRYDNLERDKEAEAREHEFWARALRLFKIWKRECNHPRSVWSADRFWMCVPALRHYGDAMVEQAIRGIAYQPNTREMRNGGIERYDRWETLFANVGRIEWYANRAPRSMNGKDANG
jgi:hypothetical protein